MHVWLPCDCFWSLAFFLLHLQMKFPTDKWIWFKCTSICVWLFFLLNFSQHWIDQTRIGNNGVQLPFGMPCVFVTQDGDSVDGTTAVKVSLQFLRCGAVVHLQETGCALGPAVGGGGMNKRRANRPPRWRIWTKPTVGWKLDVYCDVNFNTSTCQLNEKLNNFVISFKNLIKVVVMRVQGGQGNPLTQDPGQLLLGLPPSNRILDFKKWKLLNELLFLEVHISELDQREASHCYSVIQKRETKCRIKRKGQQSQWHQWHMATPYRLPDTHFCNC